MSSTRVKDVFIYIISITIIAETTTSVAGGGAIKVSGSTDSATVIIANASRLPRLLLFYLVFFCIYSGIAVLE